MWDSDSPLGVYPVRGERMDAWILNPDDITGTLKTYLGNKEKVTSKGTLRNSIDFIVEWLPPSKYYKNQKH